MDEKEMKETIEKLKPEDGDILVYRTNRQLSDKEFAMLSKEWQSFLDSTKKNIVVAILENGDQLTIEKLPKKDLIDIVVKDIENNGRIITAIVRALPSIYHHPNGR